MQGVIYLDNSNSSSKTTTNKAEDGDKIQKDSTPIAEPNPPLGQVPAEPKPILNPPMQRYIEAYKEILSKEETTPINPIYVDEIASKIAKIYERVRRIIDWKEENLVRRTSIERILKRRLISEISEITILPDLEPSKIAGPMTLEMIRTGYFENGKIPEAKIEEIEKILTKYLYILKNSPYVKEGALAIKTKVQFYNWLLGIAACEIDETLDFSFRENLLIEFMTDSVHENLQLIPEGQIDEEEKFLQVYIAVHRALYGLDNPIIAYNVLKKRYPQFTQNNEDFTKEFASKIKEIWEQSDIDLEHPKRGEFQNRQQRRL